MVYNQRYGAENVSVLAVMMFFILLGYKWVWRELAVGYHAFEIELERLRREDRKRLQKATKGGE